MRLLWIILALAAPLFYAASNFIDRFLIEKRIKDPIFITILGGFMTFLFGAIIFILRGFPVLPLNQILILLLAGTMLEIALVPWYKAVSMDDPSRLVPLFQLIPVVVLLASYFFIGERISTEQLLGSLMIIAGGITLSVKKLSLGILQLRRSAWYMLIAIPLIASPLVIFKSVTLEQDFWNTLAYEFLGGGIGALILLYSLRKDFVGYASAIRFSTWSIIGLNELIYLLGRLIGFYAISLGPVSIVGALGGAQPLFALLIGVALSVWFPKIVEEDISRQTLTAKLAAIVVIFVGLLLVS